MKASAPLKVLLVAGEVSGDILGSQLMRSLKSRFQHVDFYGVGGASMKAEGLLPLGDMGEFPGMGLVEVLPAVPRLFRLLKRLVLWGQMENPDVCVLIDNQDFSARLAKRLQPLGTPCVQYVAPKVWAWRQGRVKSLRKVLAHVLCLFPFEVDFFRANRLPATFIGHPVVERFPEGGSRSSLKPLTLALLPGSRPNELAYHWPLFLEVFKRLKAEFPALQGVLPLVSSEVEERLRALADWGDLPISAVVGDARFAALGTASAALTKSGTNNLENALLGVPSVVAYRMHALTFALVRRLVKVPFISPTNLVAGKAIFPELIQDAATVEALVGAARPLLQKTPERALQVDEMAAVRVALTPEKPPAEVAAEVVARIVRGRKG